jgi:L-alanine-DL-glutamate epimerase-like enolase superfamily enzyme
MNHIDVGMTDLRKIATLADTWGITIAPHLFPELNVHLLASIPSAFGTQERFVHNHRWASNDLVLWENMGLLDDLWVDPLQIANGMITAPERPGHGLRFRDEVRREFGT